MQLRTTKTFTIYFSFLLTALLFVGCDSNSALNEGEDSQATGRYVIAAQPTALDNVADYLLVTDSLTSGSVSTIDNGIEQDGTYRYYITNNNKFYSMLYGQDNPGAVTAYQLSADGEQLNQVVDFQAESFHTFSNMGDDVLAIDIPRGGEPIATWYRLSTETSEFVGEGQFNTNNITDNEEWAHFTWTTQVGDELWAPYFQIKACCDDGFGTNYPNTGWIAVFSYPEMELKRVMEDDRTSYIGRYYSSGLSVDENGDVYAFSAAVAQSNGEFTSTQPSAITRVNEGATDFDEDYFFNVEEASGGYYVTDHVYASDGNALVMMQDTTEMDRYDTGNRLAVVNLYNQTLTWVDGLPDPETVTGVANDSGTPGYVSDDGSTVHVGINTEESSHVYAVDIESATATQGLEVEGGTITSIHRLESSDE